MGQVILKLPQVNLKAPNTIGKGTTMDKMLSNVKAFFSKKK